MKFSAQATLDEIRDFLRKNWSEGTHCPACKQSVKLYKRSLTSSMAYGLILLSKADVEDAEGWIHIEDYFKSLDIPSSIRGDISKLVYWGLLEKYEGKRDDGSNRNGKYRVTPKGYDFVRGKLEVYSHGFMYNNEFKGFTGELIKIRGALGQKFNYDELMAG